MVPDPNRERKKGEYRSWSMVRCSNGGDDVLKRNYAKEMSLLACQ